MEATATETSAAPTETSSYNHCKRCGRRIKAPQEYGRVCARKIQGSGAKTDGITKDGHKICMAQPGVHLAAHTSTPSPEHDTTPITSTSELIKRVNSMTASRGMCWACKIQLHCHAPRPAVVCTAFQAFHI